MNLKSTSLLLLAILLSGVAFSQSTFRINGKIQGMQQGAEVVLNNIENQDAKKLASAKVVNGSFVLQGEYKHPVLCAMKFLVPSTKKKGSLYSAGEIRLMLESTPITFTSSAKIILSDSTNAYKESASTIKGGKIQKEFKEYLRAVGKQEQIAEQASFAEANAWFDNNGDEDKIVSFKKEESEEKLKLQNMKNDFMRQHPNYAISGTIAVMNMMDLFKYTPEELKSMAACMKNNPDTARVHWIDRNLDKVLKYAKGAAYTDFSGMKIDGTSKKLSECMKAGTYTLIDFWASWCGPCRSAIPKVKKMYEKYNGKLVVVSASCDQKEDDWKKAEKEEAMPWEQLLVSQKDLAGAVGRAYQISSIPRLVLINPQGDIIVVTYDPKLIESTLDGLIK
jgi:thiol-disulfide isomerase/thioredoxin